MRSPGVEGATGPFVLRVRDVAMLEESRSTGRTANDSDGDRPYILLHFDHPAYLRAERLLAFLGGCRFLRPEGVVFGFTLTSAG